MKKFARIEVNDNWADEMDIEYVTYMPMPEWRKLEKRIAKYTAFIQVSIGSNEGVEYDGGEDYLEHCHVTEVDAEGETHGFDCLDPNGILEGLIESQKEERRVGKATADATRFLKKLYREIVENYDANKQTKYVVHMKCVNSPRGYFGGTLSKSFSGSETFRFKCTVSEVHFIQQDGKTLTMFDRARIDNDIDKGISKFIDDWKIGNYTDHDLKGIYSQTVIDNHFLAKVDNVEMLASNFMDNPLRLVNRSKADLDYFKSHAMEFVEKDYYQMFDTRKEAEDVVELIEQNMKEILDAGYSQELRQLDKFVDDKKKQLKALYAQEV